MLRRGRSNQSPAWRQSRYIQHLMTNALRRKTVTVRVGPVSIGSEHPIVVQSMTNTDTADVAATTEQIRALAAAGSELVRITVNNKAAAAAVATIVENLLSDGLDVPIVGDFHYNGHKLLADYPDCARALAKYRINPGNVGAKRRDENFRTIVELAVEHGKPVRIGVNWGSLDKVLLTEMMDANSGIDQPLDARDVMLDAMVESAMRSARLAEEVGLRHDMIVISAKVSSVPDLYDVYDRLAQRSDYPLHLGLTEAGMGMKGIVASTAGISTLLRQGVGDTVRVSLTPEPGGDRTEEVRVAQQILQSLGIRANTWLQGVTAFHKYYSVAAGSEVSLIHFHQSRIKSGVDFKHLHKWIRGVHSARLLYGT